VCAYGDNFIEVLCPSVCLPVCCLHSVPIYGTSRVGWWIYTYKICIQKPPSWKLLISSLFQISVLFFSCEINCFSQSLWLATVKWVLSHLDLFCRQATNCCLKLCDFGINAPFNISVQMPDYFPQKIINIISHMICIFEPTD